MTTLEGAKLLALTVMGTADEVATKVVPYAVMGVSGQLFAPKVVIYTVLGSPLDLTGKILRTDDGIWEVTDVTEGNTLMTLDLWEEPKRIIHETGDDF